MCIKINIHKYIWFTPEIISRTVVMMMAKYYDTNFLISKNFTIQILRDPTVRHILIPHYHVKYRQAIWNCCNNGHSQRQTTRNTDGGIYKHIHKQTDFNCRKSLNRKALNERVCCRRGKSWVVFSTYHKWWWDYKPQFITYTHCTHS